MRTPPLPSRSRALRALGRATWLLALSAAPASAAPEEPLETDRPDLTETSTVVGKGRLQIETGLLRERRRTRRGDERVILTPTLFRYGFHPRWEARLETEGYARLRAGVKGDGGGTSVSRTSGYSPIDLGLKRHLRSPGEGLSRPSLGALLHLALPSGSSEFRARKVGGEVKLLADWTLGPGWDFGANAGIQVQEDARGEHFPALLFTGSLSRDLTRRLRTYLELALQAPESSSGRTGLILDGGFAWLLDPDTQLDLALGTGLVGRASADLFWTVGWSRRF